MTTQANLHQINNEKLLIVGVVRNCAKHLENDVNRLKVALSDFKTLHWLLIESDSEDESVTTLINLSKKIENFDYISLGHLRQTLPLRTERIAHCRNAYLKEIQERREYADITYVAVSDFDGLNTLLTRDAVRSCWDNEEWVVCTANQEGPYYDIWALRHDDWSPNDCWKQNRFLGKYNSDYEEVEFAAVYSRMITIPKTSNWIEVNSSFGGFAFYKKEVLKLGSYIGTTLDGDEICEHVTFHQSIREHGHKIFINPKLINAGVNEHSAPAIKRKFIIEQLKIIARWFKRQKLEQIRTEAKRILGERGFKALMTILGRGN